MDALKFALTLAAELIPLFLLISTIVYLVVEKVTPARVRALLGGRSRWVGVPLSAGLGALTPFCSCSTVPLVNGMRAAGIPVASLIAFLIASPLINPVAVALLGSAVGVGYAVLYAAAGVAFAMVAGVVVERWYARPLPEVSLGRDGVAVGCESTCAPAPPSPSHPTLALARTGTGSAGLAVLPLPVAGCCGTNAASVAVAEPSIPAADLAAFVEPIRVAFGRALADLRKLWVALALAIGVGAVIHGYVPAEFLASIAGPGQPWAIPAAALLGVPVYASVVVLLPLGTTLLAKGVGLGAVTAFLMGASGFSLPEGIMLSRILPIGLLLRILAVFCVGVVLIGYGFAWIAG